MFNVLIILKEYLKSRRKYFFVVLEMFGTAKIIYEVSDWVTIDC